MAETDREMGFWEYACVVCRQRMTSSTIFAGQTYDGGQHCDKPVRQVRWVATSAPVATK